MEIRVIPLPEPTPYPEPPPAAVVMVLRWLASLGTPLAGVNPAEINRHFLKTLRQNDNEAVIATENLFFVMRSAPVAYDAFVMLLMSGLLAPRPAALLLARVWHSGRIDALKDVEALLFRPLRDQAGEVLMDVSGWEIYSALPDRMTIYRGTRNRENDRRPSWTLSLPVARIFAGVAKGEDEGRVLTAEIAKRDVLAVFNLTGEREAVIDPVGLRKVGVIEDGLPRVGTSPFDVWPP